MCNVCMCLCVCAQMGAWPKLNTVKATDFKFYMFLWTVQTWPLEIFSKGDQSHVAPIFRRYVILVPIWYELQIWCARSQGQSKHDPLQNLNFPKGSITRVTWLHNIQLADTHSMRLLEYVFSWKPPKWQTLVRPSLFLFENQGNWRHSSFDGCHCVNTNY